MLIRMVFNAATSGAKQVPGAAFRVRQTHVCGQEAGWVWSVGRAAEGGCRVAILLGAFFGGRRSSQQFIFSIFNKKNVIFFLQKCSNLHERCGMCWNLWKMNFLILAISIIWYMVVFLVKISTFSVNCEYKSDHN